MARTQAQVKAGTKRHSIQTFTATMATISAVRATRCVSQSPLTPSPPSAYTRRHDAPPSPPAESGGRCVRRATPALRLLRVGVRVDQFARFIFVRPHHDFMARIFEVVQRMADDVLELREHDARFGPFAVRAEVMVPTTVENGCACM